jgi:hypothetical protein
MSWPSQVKRDGMAPPSSNAELVKVKLADDPVVVVAGAAGLGDPATAVRPGAGSVALGDASAVADPGGAKGVGTTVRAGLEAPPSQAATKQAARIRHAQVRMRAL